MAASLPGENLSLWQDTVGAYTHTTTNYKVENLRLSASILVKKKSKVQCAGGTDHDTRQQT